MPITLRGLYSSGKGKVKMGQNSSTGIISSVRFDIAFPVCWYPKSHAQKKLAPWLKVIASWTSQSSTLRVQQPKERTELLGLEGFSQYQGMRKLKEWVMLPFIFMVFGFLCLKLYAQSFHESRQAAYSQQARNEHCWVQMTLAEQLELYLLRVPAGYRAYRDQAS